MRRSNQNMNTLAQDRPGFNKTATEPNLGPAKKNPSNAKPSFAFVLRDFLMHPPICPANNPIKGSLTPFETALAFAAFAEARFQIKGERQQQAYKAGDRAIKSEQKRYDWFREDWQRVN